MTTPWNKNSIAFIRILLCACIGLSTPATAQNVENCVTNDLTEFQLVEQILLELDGGNYQQVANLLNIDRAWSNSDLNSVASSINGALNGSEVVSCTLLQKKLFSDQFKTEVLLVQFEETNLHFFVAAVLREGQWVVIRFQLESDFNTIFNYLK